MEDKTAGMGKAPEIVAALERACHDCNPTPCCEYEVLGKAAADMIKALATRIADLEAQHRTEYSEDAGYDCAALGQLWDQLSAVTNERNAAVESWRGFCAKCKWNGKQYLSDGKMDDRCKTCRENNKCNWEWRGPQGGRGGL